MFMESETAVPLLNYICRHITMTTKRVTHWKQSEVHKHLPLLLANFQIKCHLRNTFMPFGAISSLELKLSLFNKDKLPYLIGTISKFSCFILS